MDLLGASLLNPYARYSWSIFSSENHWIPYLRFLGNRNLATLFVTLSQKCQTRSQDLLSPQKRKNTFDLLVGVFCFKYITHYLQLQQFVINHPISKSKILDKNYNTWYSCISSKPRGRGPSRWLTDHHPSGKSHERDSNVLSHVSPRFRQFLGE